MTAVTVHNHKSHAKNIKFMDFQHLTAATEHNHKSYYKIGSIWLQQLNIITSYKLILEFVIVKICNIGSDATQCNQHSSPENMRIGLTKQKEYKN